MDSQLYMLRAKKLGIKLTLARQKQNIALEDLAHKMGMHPDEINSFEKGITAPSLPQIQVLSSILQMPIDDLVNTQVLEPIQQEISPDALPRYFEIRNKMLGIQVKKNRFQQNQTVEQLSALCEISPSDLDLYESGGKPIPLPVMQKLSEVLQLPYSLQHPSEVAPEPPVSEENKLETPEVGETPTEGTPLPQPEEEIVTLPGEPATDTGDWQSLISGPDSDEQIEEQVKEEAIEATVLPEEWQSLVSQPEPGEVVEEQKVEIPTISEEWHRPEPEEVVEEEKVENPVIVEEWQTPEPVTTSDTIPSETTDVLSDIESLQQVYAGEPLAEPETITATEALVKESNTLQTELSDEIRNFINNPVNQPYLELALKLSRMDAKKLREIAESLLEITL